jgi:hypothetical protein
MFIQQGMLEETWRAWLGWQSTANDSIKFGVAHSLPIAVIMSFKMIRIGVLSRRRPLCMFQGYQAHQGRGDGWSWAMPMTKYLHVYIPNTDLERLALSEMVSLIVPSTMIMP